MPKKKVSTVPTVRQIEQQIFEREGIRVVFRLPTFLGAAPHDGKGYDYERALGDQMSLAHLFSRICTVFGEPVPFVVVRGDGKIIDLGSTGNGGKLNSLLSTIRNTYA